MNEATRKILILGGYGVFGGRLAQLLAADARLTLIIDHMGLLQRKRGSLLMTTLRNRSDDYKVREAKTATWPEGGLA